MVCLMAVVGESEPTWQVQRYYKTLLHLLKSTQAPFIRRFKWTVYFASFPITSNRRRYIWHDKQYPVFLHSPRSRRIRI